MREGLANDFGADEAGGADDDELHYACNVILFDFLPGSWLDEKNVKRKIGMHWREGGRLGARGPDLRTKVPEVDGPEYSKSPEVTTALATGLEPPWAIEGSQCLVTGQSQRFTLVVLRCEARYLFFRDCK